MDNSEIALVAVSFLAENLTKGVLSAVGKDVWTFISGIFSTDSEKKSLETFVSKPSDPLIQGKVIGKLEGILDANPMLIISLQKLLNNVTQAPKSNTQSVMGNGNTTIQDINNSNITTNG